MTSSESAKASPSAAARRVWALSAGVAALAGAAWGIGLFQVGGWPKGNWPLWTVFGNLGLEWEFGSGSLAMGAALVLSLGLTVAGGAVVLALLKVKRANRVEALALSYVFGVGAFGLIGEFLALAGWLEGVPMWIASGLAFGLGLRTVRRRWREDGDRRLDWAWLAPFKPMDRKGRERQAEAEERGEEATIFERVGAWGPRILCAQAGAILFLCAWHALLYPVVYWDAMILYVGYARTIYEAGGVGGGAEKIVGQIGVGLGANYPHLFAFYHVAMAKMAFMGWSTLYAQAVSPLCALASAVLVASTARRLGMSRLAAAGAALLMVSAPLAVFYAQYASNYMLAVALTAAFLWGAAETFQTRTWPTLAVCLLSAAMAVHVNYLMWALWLAGAVFVFMCLPAANAIKPEEADFAEADDPDFPSPDSEFLRRFPLVLSGKFWGGFLMALALALPWNVRNVVKTGNPVYAFYYQIFPSKRVNPEVMESAREEWVRNGAGIGGLALQLASARGDENPSGYTLMDKLRVTPIYFGTGPAHAYRLAPLFLGFAVPGMALWAFSLLANAGALGKKLAVLPGVALALGASWLAGKALGPPLAELFGLEGALADWGLPAGIFLGLALFGGASMFLSRPGADDEPEKEPSPWAWAGFGALCWFLVFFFLFYHYAVADFYLYQILPFLVPLAFFAAVSLELAARLGALVRILLFAMLFSVGIVPGLAFATMGGKLVSPRPEPGYPPNPQFELYALRHPLMEANAFYELRYGPAEVEMWEYINKNLAGERILTHENRHLAFEPGIELVHLDDWELQQLYGLPTPAEKLQGILDLGLKYYLYAPNEDKHPVNAKLELGVWLGGGPELRLIYPPEAKPGVPLLYKMNPPR